MFRPGERRSAATLKVPFASVAATPLTSTREASAYVPVTSTVPAANVAISAGVVMETDGLPVTRLRVRVTGPPVGLPEASVQRMVTRFGPSCGSSAVPENEPFATTAGTP
ncbi:MAG: hypothetical protein WBX15_04020, partial [Thermoanaerobaculia bacterium]